MTTLSLVVSCALGILAAPLLVAGSAKLLVTADRLSWPYGAGLLAPPWGPRLVGAAECAAAVLLVALPNRPACAVAVLAYGTLTVAAQRLRGERCACFGVARLAAVGRGHVAANAAATVAAAALAPAAASSALSVRGLGLALAAAALASLLWRLDRRAAAGPGVEGCDEPVRGVRVYVSENCPACRSLSSLLAKLEGARRSLVDTVVVGDKDALPPTLQGIGVPAATGLDAAGQMICSPVSGIGDVKALVDRIVIGLDDRAPVERAVADRDDLAHAR
jgi:hypothetical protein